MAAFKGRSAPACGECAGEPRHPLTLSVSGRVGAQVRAGLGEAWAPSWSTRARGSPCWRSMSSTGDGTPAVLAQRQPGRLLADMNHPCGAWARRTNILYPIYKLLLSTRCIVPVRRYAPPLNAWVHVILSLIHVMSSSMRGSASQLCEGKSFLRYFCSKLMDL